MKISDNELMNHHSLQLLEIGKIVDLLVMLHILRQNALLQDNMCSFIVEHANCNLLILEALNSLD